MRSLLPPNASGSRSSRLIHSSARPPSAADSRGSGASGDGPSSSAIAREAAIRIGRPGGHAADGTRSYHRPHGHPRHPGRPLTRRSASTRAWSARSRSPQPTVGVDAALFVDRLDGARRPDPDPSPRRLRDLDLHPVRRGVATRSGRPAWSTRSTAATGDFVYIPAGEIHVEANASDDRAARRRADPQLPRFARGVPRRRPRRRATTCPAPC